MDTTGHPAGLPPARHASGYQEFYELKRQHRDIETIARDLARPTREVAEIYAEVYAELKSRAQVTDYLPVLVARKVRARYQAGGAPS